MGEDDQDHLGVLTDGAGNNSRPFLYYGEGNNNSLQGGGQGEGKGTRRARNTPWPKEYAMTELLPDPPKVITVVSFALLGLKLFPHR